MRPRRALASWLPLGLQLGQQLVLLVPVRRFTRDCLIGVQQRGEVSSSSSGSAGFGFLARIDECIDVLDDIIDFLLASRRRTRKTSLALACGSLAYLVTLHGCGVSLLLFAEGVLSGVLAGRVAHSEVDLVNICSQIEILRHFL